MRARALHLRVSRRRRGALGKVAQTRESERTAARSPFDFVAGSARTEGEKEREREEMRLIRP